MMRNSLYTLFVVTTMFVLNGCGNQQNKQTTLEVVDNDRHYYPIQQGKELVLVFPIKNTGNNSFVLKDMIVSCGCIVPQKASLKTIPPGSEGKLVLNYDSTKNIGYAKHYVTLYGNFEKGEQLDVTFDLNVVPDADYTRDYEALFEEHKGDAFKDLVDGPKNRIYYLDNH